MKIALRTENQSARQFPLSLVLTCALACGAWAGEDSVPARWREHVGAVNSLDIAAWAAQLADIAAGHVPEKM